MKLPKFLQTLKRPSNKLTWPFMLRRVSGHSMLPALPPGTLTLGVRWFYKLGVGDVIIFTHDSKEKIKRIESIEAGKITVAGDHPDASTDSRHFGPVHRSAILAKTIWPKTK